jgi:hypothetical protein
MATTQPNQGTRRKSRLAQLFTRYPVAIGFMLKENPMTTLQPVVDRQSLKVTGNMRSPRGFFAALVLLFAIPISLLCQTAFGIEFEITFHFLLALSSGLIALAVFDFKLPRWITWLGSGSASTLAAIFLLQGASLLIPNDALFYLAYQVLGQQLEAVLIDGLILWFVALLLRDSQAKTRMFGFAAVSIVVCYELYRYGLAYLGAEPAGILKLTLLLPFIWLLLESKKKLVPVK